MATVKAVYKYSDILRATVATAGNDHRLGANEAPPAIISVFLGEQLTEILDNLEKNKKTGYSDKAIIDMGISKMPLISRDNSDRNRTSPFAFTGNKFEFRAVGSSHSIAMANYTLNTIVTDILNEFYLKLDASLKKGNDINKAVFDVVIPAIKETKAIMFEGNNYDLAWEREAKRRGLPNKKTTPESLKDFVVKKNKDVFVKYNILSAVEIESIYTILLEQYIKVVNIEAETALMMAKTLIFPNVIKYQNILARSVKNLGLVSGVSEKVLKQQSSVVAAYSELVVELDDKIKKLETTLDKRDNIESEENKAEFYCREVLPLMSQLRLTVDALEEQTDDEFWSLPKYREMLFVY